MVNLKKYKALLQHFVIFLTLFSFISCSQQRYYVTKIEGKQVNVNNNSPETATIENFIQPYRERINADLNSVLAYAPANVDKNGKWQTPLGSLLADITLERGNRVFKSRENKTIDICLLNYGGIRAIIEKGNVTARTAFGIMPFENTAVVIGLRAAEIKEIAHYFIEGKKAHPLSGMTFTIDKNNEPTAILVQGKPLDDNRVYYVITSDYLSNGGDNMNFFKKGVATYDIDYKLRNILIDYFKDVDTIPVINDVRVTIE
ncbi:MAG TPA: 5'-nucleotidase [Flavobacterium sp.]|jgi:2',3'-cyclic-nucleotide 2'-phosphodiesterase (5'-nucleotidase family)